MMSSGRWVFPGRPACSNKAMVPDYAPRRTTPDPFAVRSWAIGDAFHLDASRAKARGVDFSERSSICHRFVSRVWSVRVTTSPKDTHCACEKRRVGARPPQKESGSDQAHNPSAPAQTAGDVYVPVPLRPEQSEVHPGRGPAQDGAQVGPYPLWGAARHGPFITDTAIAGKRSR